MVYTHSQKPTASTLYTHGHEHRHRQMDRWEMVCVRVYLAFLFAVYNIDGWMCIYFDRLM